MKFGVACYGVPSTAAPVCGLSATGAAPTLWPIAAMVVGLIQMTERSRVLVSEIPLKARDAQDFPSVRKP